MCRHLAYLGPRRSLESLLHDPPHGLERQSWTPRHQREGAINADGWGVGWWDPTVTDEPARYRTAAPMWTDASFRSVATVVHASAVIAAVRSATPPSPVVATGNAPFSSGRWLFSLNGFVPGYDGEAGERLRRSVSHARSIGIEGTADSEVLFALTLDALDAGASASEALLAVTGDVVATAEARLNLLLSDGHQIVATACGNSLFTLRGSGLAAGGVLISSEPLDDDPSWLEVPDRTLVEARGDQLTVTPFASELGAA